jgi:hypothetical protein
MIGRTLNDAYRLAELVGHGGFADVYLGRDRRTNAVVAVKILHAHLTRDPDVVRRFRAEASAAQPLDDPRVARVLDSGRDGETHYIAMEYVAGHTLAQIIRERGALPVGEATRIARDVLLALAAAHRAGIVHRDVKPRNVMVTPDGRAKVLDFGIARLLAEHTSGHGGVALGTAPYVSPEQARGERVDHRSDLYSLAVLLFEMLAGRPPFSAEHPWQVLRLHTESEPPSLSEMRADLPSGLVALVRRGLEKSPDLRFGSAEEMIAALDVWDAETARHQHPELVERHGDPPVQLVPAVAGPAVASPLPLRERDAWGVRPGRLALGGIALFVLLLSGVLASAETIRERDVAATAAAEATYAAGLPLTATAETVAAGYRATTITQESTATALVRTAESQSTAAVRLAATSTSLAASVATAEANATGVADAQATVAAEARALATARSFAGSATAVALETARAREATPTPPPPSPPPTSAPSPTGQSSPAEMRRLAVPTFEVPAGESRTIILPQPLRAGAEIRGTVRSYDPGSGVARVTMLSVLPVGGSPEEIGIGGSVGREARLNGGPVTFAVRTTQAGTYELRFRNDGWFMTSGIALEVQYSVE